VKRRSGAHIRVGVAGWDYPDWKGVLYPAPRPRGFDPVRFLARYIDLIEINSTFYGPASAATAGKWAERVQGCRNFRYTAKLWRRFTHERKEAWTPAEADEVRAGFDVLAEAGVLNAVLLQFPWSFRNTEPEREWLDDLATAFAEYPLVVEVRHATWNEPEFYAWLASRGIGFVNVDQPLFRRSMKPSAHATAATGYVRVHGRNYQDWFRKGAGRDARYDYLYSPDELKPWVERTREVADAPGTENVDVVFNNHYRAQAVVNALQFEKLLTGKKVAAPPLLLDAYGAELSRHAVPDRAPLHD
jgi:uncharacterized protein YecE (DUF72 family)